MEKIQKSYTNNYIVKSVKQSDINNKNICPVCGYLSRDINDMLSIKQEKACTECVINFKIPMKNLWELGQRPTMKVARERMNIFIEEVQDETA